jgi:PTS system mannose-specific IID component
MQLLFMGGLSVGGMVARDGMTGGFFGMAIALGTGLTGEQVTAVALPIAIVAAQIPNLQMTVVIPFAQKVFDSAEKGKFRNMYFWQFAGGFAKWLCCFPIMFIALYFGQQAIIPVLESMPEWCNNGLTVLGRLLPGIGLSLGMFSLVKGKDSVLAFFVIAFFAVKLLGLSTMAVVIFTSMLIWIIIANDIANAKKAGKTFNFKMEEDTGDKKRILSLKTIRKAATIYWALYRENQGHTTYAAPGFLCGLYPVMKELYPDNPEKQRAELSKHLTFYNTSPIFNGLIMGPVIAMEEDRALGREMPEEGITAFKAGLMGPGAGIGDPLWQSVFMQIIASVGLSLGLAGNIFGALLCMSPCLVFMFLNLFFIQTSYKTGSRLTELIFSSGIMAYIMKGAKILGCAAFGALAASVIRIGIGIKFDIGGVEFNLQKLIFDAIIVGILPLGIMLFTYSLMQKGFKAKYLLLIYTVVGFIGGAIGILA